MILYLKSKQIGDTLGIFTYVNFVTNEFESLCWGCTAENADAGLSDASMDEIREHRDRKDSYNPNLIMIRGFKEADNNSDRYAVSYFATSMYGYLVKRETRDDNAVQHLYDKYVKSLLEDNITSQKGVKCLVEENPFYDNGFEYGVDYLAVDLLFEKDRRRILVGMLDMFGQKQWIDLEYAKVNT